NWIASFAVALAARAARDYIPAKPAPRKRVREDLLLQTKNQKLYRFENWKRLRAPFCPYFLRSLPRESRESKPSLFSFLRSSALNSMSARAMPSFTAPAWPFTPPPATVASTLKLAVASPDTSDCRASPRCASVTKYLSKGRPLTVTSPLPGRKKTRATLDLRRPVP